MRNATWISQKKEALNFKKIYISTPFYKKVLNVKKKRKFILLKRKYKITVEYDYEEYI